ncbi:hypothetical protein C3L33_10580, partial [Rhododendron williamsianum]
MEAAVADAKNSVSIKRKTKGRSKRSRRAKKMSEAAESAKRPFLEQQNQEEELSKNKKQKISELSELPKSLQRLDAPSILKVWPAVGWLKVFCFYPVFPLPSST